MYKSHYESLNLPNDCTPEEVKAAYYELSKKFHPDMNKTEGAASKFQAITEAYEILGHEAKRKEYDRTLKGPRLGSDSSSSDSGPSGMGYRERAYAKTRDITPEEFEQFRRVWRANARAQQQHGHQRGRTKFYDSEAHWRQHYGSPSMEWREPSTAYPHPTDLRSARQKARERFAEELAWRQKESFRMEAQQRRTVLLLFMSCALGAGLIVTMYDFLNPKRTYNPNDRPENRRESFLDQTLASKDFWSNRDHEDPWNDKKSKKLKRHNSPETSPSSSATSTAATT